MRHFLIVAVIGEEVWLIECVVNFIGVDNPRFFGAELENEVDEFFDRLSAHGEHGILHHEVDECEELLELAKLVSFLGIFLDVEPAFADILERHLDDL
jgi:hypothetical protein